MKEKVKNIIKGHVDRHESSVDPAEIWSGIQSQIKKENKKNRRPIWAFFMVGVVATLFVLNYTMFGGLSNTSFEMDQVISSDNAQNFINTTNTNKEKALSSQSQKTETKNQPETNKENIVLKDLKLNAQISANKEIQNQSILNLHESQIFSIEKESVASSTNSFVETPKKLKRELPPNDIITKTSTGFQSALSISPIIDKEDRDEDIEGNEEVKENYLGSQIDRNKIGKLVLLYTNGSDGLQAFPIHEELVSADRFNIIPVKDKHFDLKSISVVASVGLFTNQIMAINTNHGFYAAERSKHEIPLEQVAIQALVTIPFAGKFNISSGLQYLMINEEFNWSGSYVVNEIGEVIDNSNFVESYYQEVNHELKNYNRTELISIPVLIGFSERHKRLNYGIKAGVNLKLNSQISGQTLDLNLVPANIADFNRKFGLGLQSKIELGYMVLPGLELLGDFSIMRLSMEEDLLSQTMQSYMFGLGLRKSY